VSGAGAGFATLRSTMSTTSELQRARDDLGAETPGNGEGPPRESRERTFLVRLAIGLVGAAAGLYLLQAMGAFLRPVLIAVLLCYAIWPLHAWLKRYMRPGLSLLIIGTGLAVAAFAVGWMIFANADEVWRDMPRYQEHAGQLWGRVKGYAARVMPSLASWDPSDAPHVPLERVGEYVRSTFGAFAGFLAQAALVGLYTVFMLAEASQFPRVIRRAFPPERAARILEVIDSINTAVIEYISVKVKVNLVVAVPAALLMLAFGVEGAVLWGVFTFFARFIPYLGGIAAYVLPAAVAALQFESPMRAGFFAVALLVLHVVGEYVIEPVMTGKAVGLSPLVVLLALAFWDLSWGIVGMILAVPLTVIVKIALSRLDATRPLARLLAED
jgi:AI-2 transport protein TqsA